VNEEVNRDKTGETGDADEMMNRIELNIFPNWNAVEVSSCKRTYDTSI